MTKNSKINIALVTLLLPWFWVCLTTTALAAETLRDRDGAIMRGTRMVLGKPYRPGSPEPTVSNTINLEKWRELKALGFNTVRVVWVDPYVAWDPKWTPKPGAWWSVDEVLPYLDMAVDNATATGMNIIINYHNVGEYIRTRDFGMMAEFWAKVAPRYKNNDRVFYELNNEQSWESSDYFDEAFTQEMRKMYLQVREDAPERRIILFSFNSLGQPMTAIADAYDWVDWNSTSVGYHFYGWVTDSMEAELANLAELIASPYTTICTEWGYDFSEDFMKPYYGFEVNAQALEHLQQSWIDWRDWNQTELAETRDVLIPDAKAKGYWWGAAKASPGSAGALSLFNCLALVLALCLRHRRNLLLFRARLLSTMPEHGK